MRFTENSGVKRGFTLVELSIVLVIIGLLIGGILSAKSMIETAKLNSFVRQMQQFDIALINYNKKFNAIPGDSGLLFAKNIQSWCAIPGVGIITDDDCSNNDMYSDAVSAREYGIYWFDLVRMEGIRLDNCPRTATENPYNVNIPVISGPQCNIAQAKIGNNIGILVASEDSSSSTNKNNSYYMMDYTGSWAGYGWGGAVSTLPRSVVFAYDAKIDDGVPNTGIVKGGTKSANSGMNASSFTFLSAYDGSSSRISIVQGVGTNGI